MNWNVLQKMVDSAEDMIDEVRRKEDMELIGAGVVEVKPNVSDEGTGKMRTEWEWMELKL